MHQNLKELIEQKTFSDLETAWMEMVENNDLPLGDFFEIAEELKKVRESEQAYLLLDILASHFESSGNLDKAMEVYRQMPYYTSDDSDVRKKLAWLYRRKYGDCSHLDEYMELSGLEKGDHFFKSIEKLEEFLRYDIGNFFFFEKYGIGEVREIIPAKKELMINFDKQKRYFVKFDVARGLLTPLPELHFLYRKHQNPAALKEQAIQNPVGLAKSILASFNEPLSAPQIKAYMDGILDKDEIAKWWEKVRKHLENDKQVRTGGKTQKTYTYVSTGLNKDNEALDAFKKALPKEKYLLAEEYAKKKPDVFKIILPVLAEIGNQLYEKEPALALDILLLFKEVKSPAQLSYSLDDLLKLAVPAKILNDLSSLNHQRFLLEYIKEQHRDTWVNVFKDLLISCNDFKVLSEIEQAMKSNPDMLKEIYHKIFLFPNQYPEQFQWLLKKMSKGELTDYLTPALLLRIIASLDHIKGIKSVTLKVLNLETFDFLLKQANIDEAKKVLIAIQNNKSLADFEKRDFLRIIEHYAPVLFKKEDDFVYTTEAALKRIKEELNRILTVDIPENKKEIGRAREFGDLSENFEYKAAKERQDQLYQKARSIEADLPRIKFIESLNIDTGKVSIGTKVTLKNVKTGQAKIFTILGRWDTDLDKNIISNESPLARSLIGKTCGHSAVIDDFEHEIIKIEKGY